MERIALCAIGRMENRYAEEFVTHHLRNGFDRIFIYDNNRDGEEKFVIKSRRVQVIPWKEDGYHHLEAYKDCYDRFGDKFSWMMFLDFDEHLIGNVKDLVKGVTAGCVSVSWECYGDSGNVTYEDKPLEERFTEPQRGIDGRSESYPENRHVKSIVRCGMGGVYWRDPHCPSGCGEYVYADNTPRKCSPFHDDISYERARVKHFYTKSLEEWMSITVKRGKYDCEANDRYIRDNAVDLYFSRNERTPEKERWLEEHGY